MGFYITFDGISGSGKGTIISHTASLFRDLGFTTAVLEDRELDPLRNCGARMLPWCEKYKINKSEFLLPLFAAGNMMSQKEVDWELSRHDIVLRDRSFITSLAYSSASFDINQKKVWDLMVNHAGIRIPDLAVIVDCDVEQAMDRVKRRKTHIDKGLGGKMSGDERHQRKIRDEFLKISENFRSALTVMVLGNRGEQSDDPNIVKRRVAGLAQEVVKMYALLDPRVE